MLGRGNGMKRGNDRSKYRENRQLVKTYKKLLMIKYEGRGGKGFGGRKVGRLSRWSTGHGGRRDVPHSRPLPRPGKATPRIPAARPPYCVLACSIRPDASARHSCLGEDSSRTHLRSSRRHTVQSHILIRTSLLIMPCQARPSYVLD